jgi:hypothetical protein
MIFKFSSIRKIVIVTNVAAVILNAGHKYFMKRRVSLNISVNVCPCFSGTLSFMFVCSQKNNKIEDSIGPKITCTMQLAKYLKHYEDS